MGAPMLDNQLYNKETYKDLKKELEQLNTIIKVSNDVNEIVDATQRKFIVLQKIKKLKRFLSSKEKEMVVANNETRIRLSKLISKNFHKLFNDNTPNKILKGGRSSLKSSFVSIKLVSDFLADDLANTVIFRKVAKYLSTSVYEQIKWAIFQLGVEDEFQFLKSPLKIVHRRSETAFYFYGVDDPLKIKSATIAKGYVKDLWFEEAAEFESKEEIDTVTDTFIRQELPDGKQVNTYFTYNPPRNPYVWINEWVNELEKSKDEDYIVHHSTYKEDSLGVLSKQFLRKVAKLEQTDKEYHDWMYGGKVIGLGNTVYNFNLFNVIDEIPEDDRLLFADVSIDTGYSTSATTFLFIGYTLKRNVIILDTYYYNPENKVRKKAPSEFSKDLFEFITTNSKKWNISVDTEVIDSADGALRNQYRKDYNGILYPAKKKQKQKMIENVEDLLAQRRVFVLDTDNNKVFLEEHRKYQWDEKKKKTDKPEVVKVDDHTCDAFQYYVNNNLDKLGLTG